VIIQLSSSPFWSKKMVAALEETPQGLAAAAATREAIKQQKRQLEEVCVGNEGMA
jgi:hypothetical protein